MRKRVTCVLVLVLLAGGYFLLKKPLRLSREWCAFCDPDALYRQTFYQDELVLALYTHKPILPGHCLIIPKKHVERFENLSEEEARQLVKVIKKVHRAVVQTQGTCAYLLLQKNGVEVGQTVPHVHFHYIPRKAKDSSSLIFILKMYWALFKKPISSAEMREAVERMQQAVNNI